MAQLIFKFNSEDIIVTSNISDKYLPGLMIGYVSSVSLDENELTKSGTVTPVVDFKHLSDVLVILQQKESYQKWVTLNSKLKK